MTGDSDARQATYRVVLNHEEQYSIWPTDREIPNGWREEGTAGTKDECLAHIDEVWTDMRPLSLRKHMEEAAGRQADDVATQDVAEEEEESLVSRLCQGSHPVEISLRPEPTAAALKEAMDRGYVFVRFTDTRGGTELGIELDWQACDLAADFETSQGRITLVGDLVLDFEPVRCTAEIDLGSMSGQGRLSVREPSR